MYYVYYKYTYNYIICAAVTYLYQSTNVFLSYVYNLFYCIYQYLASASEDGSVIVWNTSDWTVVKNIVAPFQEAPESSSFFRRVSWSPDGSYMCASNAYKSNKPIAAIINRKRWEQEVEFVGHTGPVVVVR